MAHPHILLVTGLWPTADLPSAGAFVRDRVKGLDGFTVIGPDRYDVPMPWRYLKLAWRALTARGKFDGVEAHVLFPTGLIGLLAARLRRIPLVVYVHGSEVTTTAHENALYHWLARLVATRADEVVANSEDTARLTEKLGRKPLVIPPGIDLERFRPTPRPTERRVLYLGGKRPEKGYDVALELADTLVGHFLDERTPEEIPALIAAHDIVLMPSREEGFGLAAAEAIASGRWVVAAAVGGLPEVVTDGINGTLVHDGDFARALATVPDYDPFAVAATAERFGLDRQQDNLRARWDGLVAPTRTTG